MNASGRTCERNHDDGSFGKGTKKHKCVSGGGKKRHGLESKVLDQAGWSVLNVDDWDPEGIEAPPSDKRVYDSGSHKENEQGRMSQSYNLHKFRLALNAPTKKIWHTELSHSFNQCSACKRNHEGNSHKPICCCGPKIILKAYCLALWFQYLFTNQ